jgi:hypothetical protein
MTLAGNDIGIPIKPAAPAMLFLTNFLLGIVFKTL